MLPFPFDLLAVLVALVAGTVFSQRIKDWFTGVEANIRAKANDAAATVIAAAKGEVAKAKDASIAAADSVVASAKAAIVPAAPPTPPAA